MPVFEIFMVYMISQHLKSKILSVCSKSKYMYIPEYQVQPNYFQTLMEFTKFLSNIHYLLVNNFCVVEFYHPKRKKFHAGMELLIYRTFIYNTYTNSYAKL